jgi:hypothetical protein
MKSTYRVRNSRTSLEIDPARIAKEFSQLEGARKDIGRRARGDAELADRAIARWIMDAVEHAGAQWTAKAAAALDTLHAARENLSGIFESVVKGEFPRVDRVREELTRLDKSLEMLNSPEKDIAAAEKIEPPPSGAALLDPIKDFTITTAIGEQTTTFGKLSDAQQGLVRGLVDTDASTVRKAVVAESKEVFDGQVAKLKDQLRKDGRKQEEMDAAVKAIEELNKSWRDDMSAKLPPDHILQLARKLGELPSERLRDAVTKSKLLQELMHSNPEMLKAMWQAFEKKGATYSFETYVGFIQRQIRGLLGEYQLAFDLGDGMVLLKGPDAKVTIPGTDAVAVNLKTGEVLLLDNKALQSLDPLNTVGALTRNLPRNIAKDAAEFQVKIGTGPDTPVQLSSAIKRIQEAADAIARLTAGMTKEQISKEPVQKLIQKELDDRGIVRSVANAGGTTASLSARLQRIGVTLLDVNRPLAE